MQFNFFLELNAFSSGILKFSLRITENNEKFFKTFRLNLDLILGTNYNNIINYEKTMKIIV